MEIKMSASRMHSLTVSMKLDEIRGKQNLQFPKGTVITLFIYRNKKQKTHAPVISRSNIVAVFSGTSISQALAADDSMEQQTVVIREGISRGKQKLS